MSLPSTGPISLSQVQTEFGGSNPISLSEYYYNGSYITGNNTSVPSSGTISMSNMRGRYKAYYVNYIVIGGGGAGGYGVDDGGEGNRGTYAPAGSQSRIAFPSSSIISYGGRGGENCKGNRATSGTNGGASYYGSGGAGGGLNSSGADAVNYGSGGGGGGGDSGSFFDSGGCSGEGGVASSYKSGSYWLVPGYSITIYVGSGGIAPATGYDGGNGANGYAQLTVNGTNYTYSTPGTYVLTP